MEVFLSHAVKSSGPVEIREVLEILARIEPRNGRVEQWAV
jgi:hypothetical protein